MNSTDDEGPTVQKKWFRFGLAAAALYAAFTALVALLLRVDAELALVVAVVGSIASGVAVTVFALYVYR